MIYLFICVVNATWLRTQTGCVTIVDNRPEYSSRIVESVLNALPFVPAHWPFYVHVSTSMVDVVRAARPLTRWLQHHRIVVTDEFARNVTTRDDYQRLLASERFWKYGTSGRFVVVMQTDSCFCAHASSTLDDYWSYDYIGAPWIHNVPHGVGYLHDRPHAGNGGFSLRRRSAMLRITRAFELPQGMPEDVYFHIYGERMNCSFASPSVMQQFSVEHAFFATPVGVHQVNRQRSPDLAAQLLPACPCIANFG